MQEFKAYYEAVKWICKRFFRIKPMIIDPQTVREGLESLELKAHRKSY